MTTFHALPPEDVCQQLKTRADVGLTAGEARQRLERDGPNSLTLGPPLSPWKIFLAQFQDLMVLILVLACGVAVVAWMAAGAHGVPADAIVIGAILVLNATLGFVQEYRAEQTMQSLQEMATPSKCQVVRDGERHALAAKDLVAGDILKLQEGDRIPADGQLVKAHALSVDQSMLTGESLPVKKAAGAVAEDAALDSRSGSLHAGTSVLGGEATVVITATGNRTELGKLAQTLQQTRSEPTPLQLRLAALGTQIGKGVLLLSILITVTILGLEGQFDLATVSRVLMFAVALAVAAVPEGLPAVLTISLAVGTRRLAQHQAVVRKMAAVETLGSVTVIATDKTGTITQNRLSVRDFFGEPEALLRVGALANSARWVDGEPAGDPLDVALLLGAQEHGLDPQALQKEWVESEREPFTAESARMSSRRNGTLFVKGSLAALTGGNPPAEAVEAEAGFAAQGLRVLAMAEDEKLLGLVAFGDPPRAEAAEAIKQCRAAGIRVVMLTGDHPATAGAIGAQVGLCEVGDRVVRGPEVEAADAATLREMARECNVFARVSPASKLRLVEELVGQGEVLAMTGDGVNDAPALKKVQVGVAMGSGSSVALEASQVVLLDDNFATLVRAVRGGREVYRSLQQFIAFLFSGNFGVVLAMFAGSIFAKVFQLHGGDGLLLPLTAGQILWMNLAVDGAPAVAFSLGGSDSDVMSDPPRPPKSPILGAANWRYLAFCGSFVAVGLLTVLDLFYPGGVFTAVPGASVEYARSAAFYFVVCVRLCNAFNFSGFTWPIALACLASWLLTLGVLYVPLLASLFNVEPLALAHVLELSAVAPTVLIAGWVYRKVTGYRG
ncbi:MAG: cation-translocating P-type ATPase [Candidatus Eremiobacteraeota bacterium]|nr:cation-translocating P-type ATPase [Candidatus Eremiobacteraeota bacterium]